MIKGKLVNHFQQAQDIFGEKYHFVSLSDILRWRGQIGRKARSHRIFSSKIGSRGLQHPSKEWDPGNYSRPDLR